MPVLFNSFGDIVTALELAWRLRAALSGACAASFDIRALLSDVESFTQMLQHIRAAIEARSCPLESAVENGIRNALAACQDVLRIVLGKISAFETRMTRKVGVFAWQQYWAVAAWSILGGRNEVDSLRTRLSEQLSVIQTTDQDAIQNTVKRHEITLERLYGVVQDMQMRFDVGVPPFMFCDPITGVYRPPFARTSFHRFNDLLAILIDSPFPIRYAAHQDRISLDSRTATVHYSSDNVMIVTLMSYTTTFMPCCFFKERSFGQYQVLLGSGYGLNMEESGLEILKRLVERKHAPRTLCNCDNGPCRRRYHQEIGDEIYWRPILHGYGLANQIALLAANQAPAVAETHYSRCKLIWNELSNDPDPCKMGAEEHSSADAASRRMPASQYSDHRTHLEGSPADEEIRRSAPTIASQIGGTYKEIGNAAARILCDLVVGGTLAVTSDFLGGQAGCLADLFIRHLFLPATCPALSTVTALDIHGPVSEDASANYDQLFALCPNLRYLRLSLLNADLAHTLPTCQAPHSLQELFLEGIEDDGYDLMQHYTSWKTRENLRSVTLAQDCSDIADLAALICGAAALFIGEEDAADRTLILASGASGWSRGIGFQDLDDGHAEHVANMITEVRESLPDLETINMRALYLDDFLPLLASWPKLKHLVLAVSPDEDDGCYHWDLLNNLPHLRQHSQSLVSLGVSVIMYSDPPTEDDARALLAHLTSCDVTEIVVSGFSKTSLAKLDLPTNGSRIRFRCVDDEV
ncbi:hypothetical protein AURDEDRAFT_128105 [Auricularia subglabra TFB-10046 SS5]|uniref:Uncharacterized protein n=1 Tax=Auricularia subglabra (strain TFB-10046 / SS5) TaxID=717982 RepID=J0WWA3_AURST|nr:hypothetical protein AURDEDRAFT_128105 [Auricularia subglabra TFB-10046 SS5]